MNTEEKEKEELEGDVIVVDIGSGTIKAGWAGEDAPRCAVPALVLEGLSQDATMNDSQLPGVLVGKHALQVLQSSESEITPTYAVERGEVINIDALQKIMDYIFKEELHVDQTQYPVLLTCPPLTERAGRAAIAKMMFRTFKVPSLAIANQAVLSLFSTGRTTGIVLEVGEGVTHAVPVFEGFCLTHAVLRLPLAGADLTRHLMKILSQRGINFRESHFDIVRDIKEKLCAVRLPDEMNQKTPSPDEMTYELPDGQIIRIDDECRYKTTEILFKPELFRDIAEKDHDRAWGIHTLVYNSIMMCDPYLQKDLLKNIVLAGGSSMLAYFGERMRKEIGELAEGHQYTQVITDSQRKYAAWVGASMFASLPTFSQIKITQQEYAQDPNPKDPTIVHKKYF